MVTVAAGEPGSPGRPGCRPGWVGVEALSGIPGSVGATPIQNVGAYGQEVADTVATVRMLGPAGARAAHVRRGGLRLRLPHQPVQGDPQRYVVLAVTFQLRLGDLSPPVRYAELARTLGVPVGGRAPTSDVREAVLALRRRKGMVLDPDDHDTWSAGSFFTNPFVGDAGGPAAGAPLWDSPTARSRPAPPGSSSRRASARATATSRVSLSTKHTLALTNRGGARTATCWLSPPRCSGGAPTVRHLAGQRADLVGCSLSVPTG